MGLFDRIRCEVPLPDGFVGELQTKDFTPRGSGQHVITADGRLLIDRGYDEPVPEHERPYRNAPSGSAWRLVGSSRHVQKLVDENFDGVINFLGLGEDLAGHEYAATFKNGQLVEIKVVP